MPLRIRNRSIDRRRALAALALAAACRPARALLTANGSALRFGTTPVFLDDQIALLGVWQRYLEDSLQRPVVFVQRGSYREIIDLVLSDRVDVAWICGYPFVVYAEQMRLVAVPTYLGHPLYQSYLIVPERDRATRHIVDLGGAVFAYSDPLSNSGFLVPRTELIRAGLRPETFFRRTFFTFGHRKVVQAVQAGLAAGGAVDGYVWDTLVKQHPDAAAGVRVAWRSERFGFPPVVARASLAADERAAVARALLQMRRSAAGTLLLERLNIDGFEAGAPSLFDGIRGLVGIAGAPTR